MEELGKCKNSTSEIVYFSKLDGIIESIYSSFYASILNFVFELELKALFIFLEQFHFTV